MNMIILPRVVLSLIFSSLDPASRISLSKTCKTFLQYYRDERRFHTCVCENMFDHCSDAWVAWVRQMIKDDPIVAIGMKRIPILMGWEIGRYADKRYDSLQYPVSRVINWYRSYQEKWLQFYGKNESEGNSYIRCGNLFPNRNDNAKTKELCTKLFDLLFRPHYVNRASQENDLYFVIVYSYMMLQRNKHYPWSNRIESNFLFDFVYHRNANGIKYLIESNAIGRYRLGHVWRMIREIELTHQDHACLQVLQDYYQQHLTDGDSDITNKRLLEVSDNPLSKIEEACRKYNVF